MKKCNLSNIVAISKVHGNGRVHLPVDIRERLDVRDGDKIYFILDGDRIVIEKCRVVESRYRRLPS